MAQGSREPQAYTLLSQQSTWACLSAMLATPAGLSVVLEYSYCSLPSYSFEDTLLQWSSTTFNREGVNHVQAGAVANNIDMAVMKHMCQSEESWSGKTLKKAKRKKPKLLTSSSGQLVRARNANDLPDIADMLTGKTCPVTTATSGCIKLGPGIRCIQRCCSAHCHTETKTCSSRLKGGHGETTFQVCRECHCDRGSIIESAKTC